MSERRLTSRSRSRSDTDGFGPIKSWDDGVDTITINVPAGRVYSRYLFYNESFLGSATVISSPRKRAAGRITFKVKWNYPFLGKSQYRLDVFGIPNNHGPLHPINIRYGAPGWEHQVQSAIDQQEKFTISIRGLEAISLRNLLHSFQGSSRREVANLSNERVANQREAVAIIAITAGAIVVIALAGMATLAFVMKSAIDAGLCPKASQKSTGPNPFENELIIIVEKC